MKLTTRDMTEIAIFTALLSVTSILSLPIGDVPITLQTLVVMMIGLFLSPRNSAVAVVAYLIVGSIGVPVFAAGKGGFGIILGPTGGFLIAFIFMVIFISKMKRSATLSHESPEKSWEQHWIIPQNLSEYLKTKAPKWPFCIQNY